MLWHLFAKSPICSGEFSCHFGQHLPEIDCRIFLDRIKQQVLCRERRPEQRLNFHLARFEIHSLIPYWSLARLLVAFSIWAINKVTLNDSWLLTIWLQRWLTICLDDSWRTIWPQKGWFIMENPIKMDDLGVPYFWKHPCGSFPDKSPWSSMIPAVRVQWRLLRCSRSCWRMHVHVTWSKAPL